MAMRLMEGRRWMCVEGRGRCFGDKTVVLRRQGVSGVGVKESRLSQATGVAPPIIRPKSPERKGSGAAQEMPLKPRICHT